MHNQSWDDIRFFLAVARAGSVSAAAKTLHVDHSTVSRRLAGLEKRLGVRLFERASSGWLLSRQGETALATAERMAEDASAFSRLLLGQDFEMEGEIRISAEDSFYQTYVIDGIRTFMQAHPKVTFLVLTSDTVVNLARREADIAFRTTNRPPATMIGTEIGKVGRRVYGVAELSDLCARDPHSPEIQVACLEMDEANMMNWLARTFPNAKIVVRTNTHAALVNAIRAGLGIGLVPCAIADRDDSLRAIDVEGLSATGSLWILSHADLRQTARIRAFRQHMIGMLSGERERLAGTSLA